MANFCSYPKGDRISEVTLPNSMDPASKVVTIGLWGFRDFDGNELEILAPPYVSVKKGAVSGLVRLYELSSYHPGTWTLEARTQNGDTWDTLSVSVKANSGKPAGGHKYTQSPNEVATRTTTPSAREVVSMLLSTWPELTQQGARTLTSQFMVETTEGKNCYNWNLGNVKAGADQLHMYLQNVWECDSASGAADQVARGNGLAHVATAEDIRKHPYWQCAQTIVVFEPPHAQCRFRAYNTLSEGAQRWVGLHQSIAGKNVGYLANLNAGDTAAIAHTLKQVNYYSGDEPGYKAGMAREKARIDRELGPL